MRKIFLIFLLLLGSCAQPPIKNLKPVILVTIPPYADLTGHIVGDFADIEIFVPPGANPHIYEPTPREVEKFARATLWFRYGDPIELKVLPFLRDHQVKDVDLSEGFSLICSDHTCHHHAEGKDHHLWLDPLLAKQQARKITDTLILQWPEHRLQFEKGYSRLSNRLQALDQELASKLLPFKGSYLFLSHPALGYYCERYALHQFSVECEGKDPRPQQVAHLIQIAASHPVKVVLLEPQYSTKGAEIIAEKLHLPTAFIDPYAFDYFQTLHQITSTILHFYDHPS